MAGGTADGDGVNEKDTGMTIVILNDGATVNGGAAKIALEEARVLAQAGHTVHLFCGSGPVAPELVEVPNLEIHRFAEHDILTDPHRLRAAAHGWWRPDAAAAMRRLLDGLDARDTVVHVHSWTKALSPSPIRVAIERGFEVVFTMHDFLLACPTGTLFLQHTQQKCTLRPMSWACIRTNCDKASYGHKLYRVGRKAVQSAVGLTPDGARHFIYYSQLAHDLLRPYLPGDARMYSLPNAIEMPEAPAADVAQNSEFVFLGRLVREKGPVMLARAALAEGVPVRLIGEGPERAAIAEENPEAMLPGWMSHADGVAALRNARALVFPSLWYETLGLVVLEAAGNGVPSIVPDTSAARESVVDGVTGLYFRSGDEADLRAKIALLKNPETARRMGAAAYERFWAPPGYGLRLHRERLERIYARILGRIPEQVDEATEGAPLLGGDAKRFAPAMRGAGLPA